METAVRVDVVVLRGPDVARRSVASHGLAHQACLQVTEPASLEHRSAITRGRHRRVELPSFPCVYTMLGNAKNAISGSHLRANGKWRSRDLTERRFRFNRHGFCDMLPSRLEGESLVQMRQVSWRLRVLQTKGRAPGAKRQIRVTSTYSGPRPSVLGPVGGTYRFSGEALLSRWSEALPGWSGPDPGTHTPARAPPVDDSSVVFIIRDRYAQCRLVSVFRLIRR